MSPILLPIARTQGSATSASMSSWPRGLPVGRASRSSNSKSEEISSCPKTPASASAPGVSLKAAVWKPSWMPVVLSVMFASSADEDLGLGRDRVVARGVVGVVDRGVGLRVHALAFHLHL